MRSITLPLVGFAFVALLGCGQKNSESPKGSDASPIAVQQVPAESPPQTSMGPRSEEALRQAEAARLKATQEKKAFITQELFDKILAEKMTDAQITEILGTGRASGRTTIPQGMTEKVWEDSKHNSIMIQFKDGKPQGGKSTIYDNK